MAMRGLPAAKRAVPGGLFHRPSARRSDKTRGSKSLLGLVEALPADLRHVALTHSSRAVNRLRSNERLEFLGDSVLGLSIAAELYQRYPEHEEGDLARLKACVVSRAVCSEIAADLGVAELMAESAANSEIGRGDAAPSKAMAGNALEALIGAVFLTFGFKSTSIAVVGAFEEAIERGMAGNTDFKTSLQEMLAQRGLQPRYSVASESGPPHARTFCSEVLVGERVYGRGVGTTIKMSEQAAAKEALGSYDTEERDS